MKKVQMFIVILLLSVGCVSKAKEFQIATISKTDGENACKHATHEKKINLNKPCLEVRKVNFPGVDNEYKLTCAVYLWQQCHKEKHSK